MCADNPNRGVSEYVDLAMLWTVYVYYALRGVLVGLGGEWGGTYYSPIPPPRTTPDLQKMDADTCR